MREKIGKLHYVLKRKVIKTLDEYGIISVNDIYPEEYYAEMARPAKRHDAKSVVGALIERFSPSSVIDFGCGAGLYLSYFQQQGITVQGIEGATKALKHAEVDENFIDVHDLRNSYQSTDFYDLALCIEVAEHLPEEAANTLVDSVCNSSNTIFFTAATPGQGGTHHINEQPRSYWIEKFEKKGYEYHKEDVKALRGRINVKEASWILENMFVFRKQA